MVLGYGKQNSYHALDLEHYIETKGRQRLCIPAMNVRFPPTAQYLELEEAMEESRKLLITAAGSILHAGFMGHMGRWQATEAVHQGWHDHRINHGDTRDHPHADERQQANIHATPMNFRISRAQSATAQRR